MNEMRELIASAAFSDLDRHFAMFMEAQSGGGRPLLALAAALVSRRRSEGHICLDLASVTEALVPDKPAEGVQQVRVPALGEWIRELRAAPVVGGPGEFKPLVLDTHERLYLHRYWEYERSLAIGICERVGQESQGVNREWLGAELKRLFQVDASRPVDWQCVAAFAAARKKFCVISGGPGTGKTHTLVVILAMLLDMERNRKLRIAVAAPTGKAAARIQDSIRGIKTTLPCSDTVKAQLPERAMTLHRLLGNVPDSPYFRHNARNQLPYDVIAVDEVSMVDLALMAKLFQAVPASARVILLGDKDQLASVEAGAVLGEICSAPALDRFSRDFSDEFKQLTGWTLPASAAIERTPGLTDSVVQLRKNHRFSEKSAIFQLSTAINDGLIDVALDILRRGSSEPGGDLASATLPPRSKLKMALKDKLISGFREFLETKDPLQALGAMNRFRILCALREGAFGVAGLNRLAEELLEEAGLIHAGSLWYSHRPLMITRNDYNLKLFNGDIGVILPEPENGEPRAFFVGPENTLRKFLPIRLPECETAYAMTVHKSQGSEFDRVLMILPDRESPVLSRELLYTGITRARLNVEVWFDEEVFRKGLSRRVQRTSGLGDALWKGGPGPQDNN